MTKRIARPTAWEGDGRHRSAHGCVGLLGEQLQGGEEFPGLADEEAVVGQGFNRAHRRACCVGGANDGDGRELATEKDGWFGHDQIGLEILAAKGWTVEVGEDQSVGGIGQGGRVSGLIVPRLEVCRLRRADTEQDAQHFDIADALGQRGVKAGAALFDEGEVEASRVGDGLDMFLRGQIGVGAWDGRELPLAQTGYSLREGIAEIGILRAATVARPPAGVHRELHQVGKATDLLGARRLAARQSAKLIQIDGINAFRYQVGIDESEVAHLIFGIVMDILRHIAIEYLKSLDIRRAAAAAGDFAILNAAQFVVLLPQISLDDFGCRQEAQDSRVSLCEAAAVELGEGR